MKKRILFACFLLSISHLCLAGHKNDSVLTLYLEDFYYMNCPTNFYGEEPREDFVDILQNILGFGETVGGAILTFTPEPILTKVGGVALAVDGAGRMVAPNDCKGVLGIDDLVVYSVSRAQELKDIVTKADTYYASKSSQQ